MIVMMTGKTIMRGASLVLHSYSKEVYIYIFVLILFCVTYFVSWRIFTTFLLFSISYFTCLYHVLLLQSIKYILTIPHPVFRDVDLSIWLRIGDINLYLLIKISLVSTKHFFLSPHPPFNEISIMTDINQMLHPVFKAARLICVNDDSILLFIRRN